MEVKVEYTFGLRTRVPFIHIQLFKTEGVVQPNKNKNVSVSVKGSLFALRAKTI